MHGVYCYYILGRNAIFISYFNAKLVFLVFLELFKNIFLLMILWVFKNLSHIFAVLVFIHLWWRSFILSLEKSVFL